MKSKKTIIILAAVVALITAAFFAIKAADFKVPSHGEFRNMHGGN
jgi:Spy/CpxP family protein refolding chaperone